MALYLAAAVVGVVVIVYLVVHLTKSGPNSAASGTSTPSTEHHGHGGGGARRGLCRPQAAKVGPYPLNKAATSGIHRRCPEAVGPHRGEDKGSGSGPAG